MYAIDDGGYPFDSSEPSSPKQTDDLPTWLRSPETKIRTASLMIQIFRWHKLAMFQTLLFQMFKVLRQPQSNEGGTDSAKVFLRRSVQNPCIIYYLRRD
jgi:hypothetical protein